MTSPRVVGLGPVAALAQGCAASHTYSRTEGESQEPAAQIRYERVQTLRKEHRLEGLLLTRSEDGMSLFDSADGISRHTQVAAQAREVFDVTGAGDTVIATLAAMLACGLSLREALPLANRAGGIVVGKFGTASVSYEELFA